jgi:two-component system cell cycle response regulator CtrA
MDPNERLIRRLTAERDTALEEVRQLRELLLHDDQTQWRPPNVLKLSRSESRILRTLYLRPDASVRVLYDAVYRDTAAERIDKIIDVFIWRLRRKLRPFGIVIENVFYQRTWLLPEASKAILHAMTQEERRCSLTPSPATTGPSTSTRPGHGKPGRQRGSRGARSTTDA